MLWRLSCFWSVVVRLRDESVCFQFVGVAVAARERDDKCVSLSKPSRCLLCVLQDHFTAAQVALLRSNMALADKIRYGEVSDEAKALARAAHAARRARKQASGNTPDGDDVPRGGTQQQNQKQKQNKPAKKKYKKAADSSAF